MQNARGPDRRKWNSRWGWGLKLPEGFVEHPRQVERGMPFVAEGSVAEFERLMTSLARKKRRKREAEDPEVASAAGAAASLQAQNPLSLKPKGKVG